MEVEFVEVKDHIDELLEHAEEGKVVIILRDGKPVVRIEGIEQPNTLPRIGALKGQIHMADDFDASLDEMDR